MNVDRHYYNPTPSQRAELLLASKAMRHCIAQKRRERAEREAIAKLVQCGMTPETARAVVLGAVQ